MIAIITIGRVKCVNSYCSTINIAELSILLLFVLSQDTNAEVSLLLLYFDLQGIRHFIIFYL